jgi:eukaryotic-like serine/threonine-protein kinase
MSTETSPSDSTPSPAAATTDLTGRTLGEFQIIRRLGKGGMAEVYLAEQTSLQRQVAIKVLRAEYLSDAAYVKRFRHEATAAGGLNHPNIVQVYSIGEQDGIHFIAQEYVRGGNLRDLMRKRGPLDLPLALHLMKQVAAALQVAGAAGIVHRDIKPENILLTKKGEAKVADFGLAQLTQGGERVAMTQVGITMGTPLYMSPEQVAGKPVDHRSDIYSFGAMCYHLLAGRPPFTGETPLTVAVQHLNDKPRPLREHRPDLPAAVNNLVMQMMAKRRDDRYADAQTVLTDIKSLQKQLAGKDDPSSEMLLSTSQPSRRLRLPSARMLDRPLKQQLLRLGLAGLLVLAAGAGIGWTQRLGDPFRTPLPPGQTVPQQPSIEAQYFHAMVQGEDEAAWQAVVDYPPGPDGRRDELDRKSAQVRLAILYLQHDRIDEAAKIFSEFRQIGPADAWKETHGIAGEAIVASLRGNTPLSKQLIDDVDRKSNPVIDAKLKQLLDEARERNSRR